MIQPHNGLQPICHDTDQDWSHYRKFVRGRMLFGAISTVKGRVTGLPATLGRKPVCINNQEGSNFCTAFTTSEAIGSQENIPMSPEYQTAKIGQIAGFPIIGGTDPKTALQSGPKYGALPKSASSTTFQKNGWIDPADWRSWPTSIDQYAAPYKRPGWYNVLFGGPDDLDTFEMIKLALWFAKDDAAPGGYPPVMCFGLWFNEWNAVGADGIVAMQMTPNITRHAYVYYDWTTIGGVEYIVAQLSEGEGFGNGGIMYFSREIVNKAWQNAAASGIGMYIYRKNVPPFFTQVLGIVGSILAKLGGIFKA